MSVQMDPEDIERFAHPQSSEVYTVIQRPTKDQTKADETQSEEKKKPVPPKKAVTKMHISSPNLQNDSLFSFLDRSDRKMHDQSPSSPNLAAKSSKPLPAAQPPPPSAARKPVTPLGNRPLPKLPPSK